MDTSRFNELMVKFPNWVAEGEGNQTYTFFDGLFTYSDGSSLPTISDRYHIEKDEEEDFIILELENSGKRFEITEHKTDDFPFLELNEIDGTGNERVMIFPNVHAKVV